MRLEEAGLAERRRHERTDQIASLSIDVAVRRVVPYLAVGDPVPERMQPFEAPIGRISGDDRRIDRADRYAAHPVGFDVGFMQSLVDAGLVGAERPATLQDQGDAIATIGAPTACGNGFFQIWGLRVHALTPGTARIQ